MFDVMWCVEIPRKGILKGNEVFFGILFLTFLKWHMQSGWLDCMKLMLIHEFHRMKKTKSMNFYNKLVDWWDKNEPSMNI